MMVFFVLAIVHELKNKWLVRLQHMSKELYHLKSHIVLLFTNKIKYGSTENKIYKLKNQSQNISSWLNILCSTIVLCYALLSHALIC